MLAMKLFKNILTNLDALFLDVLSPIPSEEMPDNST
ncbi:uncharacterized protein METZ01_LOCUS254258 [marine metagenome]|uniref:Uncharacterized protein n=1 Tax=marine metagenome TaxID=408172 RepID=A0A382INQ1_9ZZZZ